MNVTKDLPGMSPAASAASASKPPRDTVQPVSAQGNALLDAVMATVRTAPGSPAYQESGHEDVSYAELWRLSCRVAWRLLEVAPGRAPVVVYASKSYLAVASFLGCLLSGHAFVPVDSELPSSRVRDIVSQIEDAALACCQNVPSSLAGVLPSDRIVDVRELAADEAVSGREGELPVPPREGWVQGEQTNYVIFTSGSTGRPKGIEVSAANVANFMGWMRDFPVVSEGGRVFLDQAHYSFDLSEYELVGALSTGGCLHAVPGEVAASYKDLFEDLAGSGVEVWVSTPSFADLCLVDGRFDASLLPELRMFLFCGEELRRQTAQELRERFPDALVVNTYGPTESTVAVTFAPIGDEELAGSAPLPVGVPRPGTELRIVDHQTGEPCPAGVSGEIVIVGDTVAKGYYRNPQKTAEAFFQTTMSDGSPTRGYRTGDQGHLDEGGVLHCEGRFDSLVKLNGFRIELQEVEGALLEMPGVSQAAVLPVVRDGRVRSLRAFVVLSRRDADEADFDLARGLKADLAVRLPSYMVPRSVRILDRMPLTPNGKVDRRSLQAP